MNLKGVIQSVSDTQTINKFSKRVFTASVNQFGVDNQIIQFQLEGKSCSFLDFFAIGEFVSIDFYIAGRTVFDSGKTKTFNTLKVTKITPVHSS